MLKIFSLLLLAAGLIAIGFGFVAVSMPIIVLGIGVIVLASFLDLRLERRKKAKLSVDIADRIAALTRMPWPANQMLKVHGGLTRAVGVMLFAWASTYAVHAGISSDAIRWPQVLGGVFILTLCVLVLPIVLAGVGQPLLELDRHGFKTPIHGRIPWHAVSGIDLSQIERRGTHSHLFFSVAPYENAVVRVHWSQRVLAWFGLGPLARGVVGAQLPHSKEHPEVVYGVARFLWKQATGHDHAWHSMRSDEYNAAVRRLTSAPRLPEADTFENAEAVLAELQRASRDVALMRNEHARETTRIHWLLGAAVILLVVSLAWPWLSRL